MAQFLLIYVYHSLFICLVFSVGNQTQGFVPALYMLTHRAIPQSAFLNLSTISELWRPIWAYPKRQTRHGVCGLRKSRRGALLDQLPFLASPIGRTQGSKVQVTPGKSGAGCQARLCSAWASQPSITRESEGAPRQPQVGNMGQNLSTLPHQAAF